MTTTHDKNTVTIYEYPTCSTCRSAVKWLENEGWTVNKHHIKEHPPTVEVLTDLIARSGLDIKKWFNTSGDVYKELQLKDKLPHLSQEEKIKLLSSHGMLIKRPVVTDGERVTVGFKPEQYAENWSRSV
ncbi:MULTISPECIES: arsenate reductase family protein [Paenibacillus]|uniref:Spx/MgsR family RNA polymerase-binding regulatory protein n=1 Tax=Paenibacillus validus TaxID=44253 RepID=A0A7X3CRM1_9BACL|nr:MULTISPECIES: arsenate reductase family protein [Paenibacillus]MUG70870.1 Spx/MgsR family RNA polymerase-binding regulatory protein [Paenibacillus validus]